MLRAKPCRVAPLLAITLALLAPQGLADHRHVRGQFGADQPVDWIDMLPAPPGEQDLRGLNFAKGWITAIGLPNANAGGPGEPAAGRVLLYGGSKEGHWQLGQALEPPLGAPPHFGRALATSSAGLVVTAGGSGAGAFYVFPWGHESGFYPLPKAVPVQASPGVDFGASADAFQIASDRPSMRIVAIGSPAQGAGAGEVVVHRQQDDMSWVEEARLRGPAAFGADVALSDDVVVIGAAVLAVGAPGRDGAPGAVRVFSEDGGAWSLLADLVAPDGSPGFGSAVAMSNGILIVGAPGGPDGNGTAFVFARDAQGYASTVELRPPGAAPPAPYGSAVAIDMGVVAVASPTTDTSGGVYRFLLDRETGTFLGRHTAPAEPGAGTFAEDVAAAGPFAFLATFRPGDGVACGPAFYLGPKEEGVGPWPTPCRAPPPVATTPPASTSNVTAPRKVPVGSEGTAGSPGAGILLAAGALVLAALRRRPGAPPEADPSAAGWNAR